MQTKLYVLAGVAGILSALCLYFGSQETPWDIQSWDGNTEKEKEFRRRRRRVAVAGFVLLGLAFGLQILGVFLPNSN